MYWGPGKFGALLRKLQLNVPANVADDKQIFTSASRSIDHLEDVNNYTCVTMTYSLCMLLTVEFDRTTPTRTIHHGNTSLY